MTAHDRTPVIIGVGQSIERSPDLETASDPIDMLAHAARAAAANTSVNPADLLGATQACCAVRFVTDTSADGSMSTLPYNDPAASVAKRLGTTCSRTFLNAGGGDSGQYCISAMADMIANGEFDLALVVGGEALGSRLKRRTAGLSNQHWTEQWPQDPEAIGVVRAGVTPEEHAAGLHYPIISYPLFANGLRQKYQQSVPEHQQACGEIFSRMSQVAASNPYSWFPKAHTADEVAQPSLANRMISEPYTKYMCSIIRVNQSAAAFVCSVKKAKELGIPESHWVYLSGCSQAHDEWYVHQRANFHSSPGIRHNVSQALDMANITMSDVDYIDLYSCFPCAVQIACDEIGIPHDDPRGLTLTGGLPYFGGPGNAYQLHSIAEAVERCRRDRGSYALTTGNGFYLTKHSTGIYSTIPPTEKWRAPNFGETQTLVDGAAPRELAKDVTGDVTITTYTSVYDKTGPASAIVIADTSDGKRIIAQSNEPSLAHAATSQDWLNGRATVMPANSGVHVLKSVAV